MKMCEVLSVRQRSILLILMILFSFAKTLTHTYYISPHNLSNNCSTSLSSGAKSATCLTISEAVSTIVANTSGNNSNISLILLSGNHRLLSEKTLSGHFNLSIGSDKHHGHALIILDCVLSSKLHFTSIAHVHIRGITFKNCLGNMISEVGEFILEDSTLLGSNAGGRALNITKSMVIILRSKFTSFTTRDSLNKSQMTKKPDDINIRDGGAIFCSESNLVIIESVFVANEASRGGALCSTDGSTVLIVNSTFTNNGAIWGGVLHISYEKGSGTTSPEFMHQTYLQIIRKNYGRYSPARSELHKSGSILCIGSNFTKNRANSTGGVIYSHCKCTIHLYDNRFTFNSAGKFGGVLRFGSSSQVTILKCSFRKCETNNIGGAVYSSSSKMFIKESTFENNTAHINHSGAIHATKSHLTIESGKFHNNRAGSIGGSIYLHSNTELILQGNVTFSSSSAVYSAVINVYESILTCNGTLYITSNNGSIATAHSRVYIYGNMTFSGNNGSLYFLDTEVAITNGTLSFRNHARFIKLDSDYTLEGGCMTFFISRISINGTVRLVHNSAINGGGILSIASRISIDRNGQLDVIDNVAKESGGGLYLHNSELYIQGEVRLQGNTANKLGGGIHSISSTIVLILSRDNDELITFENNTATAGGGICMETNSKFYIKSRNGNKPATKFIANAAELFGGAIYIVDNTSRSICSGSTLQSVTASSQSECFIQILRPITARRDYPHIGHYFYFSQNTAKYGAKLFGGLLDRCTVNAFGKNILYSSIPDSFNSIFNDTTSDPVRVCLCDSDNLPNCNGHYGSQTVMKGKIFTLNVATVDHVGHEVPAIIHSVLASHRGYLGDRQQSQTIEAMCTLVNFSIITPVEDTDNLVLYAKGPCSDQGISPLKVNISFLPCQCPIGFEPIKSIIDQCICGCHHILKRIFSFIEDSDCNSELLTFTRIKDFWISVVHNKTAFLSYKQCPSDYCSKSTSPVQIDFSSDAGSDVQCALNRTGVLCGRCDQPLSVSLGSSRCIECPHLWPALFVAIFVASIVAGLTLVGIILTLNLTVATGTLNATVFYANVLAANGQLFLPFKRPNFHNVIIAWLNLDVGFDVCFFKGLKANGKIWLQLTFSVYMILIVVAIILVSHHSRKFSNLIARKNPVATLATLILLSYAKLLHGIIGILSFAKLKYTPLNGQPTSTKVVWLRDGSIEYLKGVHVLLFIVALLILLLGSLYTSILFSWQWLVRLSNKPAFSWTRSTKISSFMDAYHAPYTSRNRYWTGLLLLARIILYFIAAVNVSDEPGVNLLAVLIVTGCILLIHASSGITVYKHLTLNCIEFATYFNILSLAAVNFYILQVGGTNEVATYISISAQFIIFLCSLLHHVMSEFHIPEKINRAIIKYQNYRSHFNTDLQVRLMETNSENRVTFSEVTIMKVEDRLESESCSERREHTALF